MALSDDDVRHVAQLAQLALTDEEISSLRPQLDGILTYAEKVAEIATDEVRPTSHPFPLQNVWRDDADVAEPLSTEAVISNAPAAENDQFRVPRIIGESA